MPQKNSIKAYLEGGYYHIYNRGVENREIFLDDRDYKVFLYYLKQYLAPIEETIFIGKIQHTNLSSEIDLLSFCLMPNHFHLQIKQKNKDGITKLMRRLLTNYAMYFNKRYQRNGTLFQGIYKAVLINSDSQLLHLSRYIHLNPYELEKRSFKKLVDYPYSSYGDYLGVRKSSWVKPQEILSFFKNARRSDLKDILSYQSFVEDYKVEPGLDFENILLE